MFLSSKTKKREQRWAPTRCVPAIRDDPFECRPWELSQGCQKKSGKIVYRFVRILEQVNDSINYTVRWSENITVDQLTKPSCDQGCMTQDHFVANGVLRIPDDPANTALPKWYRTTMVLVRFYKMVLLSKLWGVPIMWWSSAQKVEPRCVLKSLQANFLRTATEARRTKPKDALEVELGMPPLDLLVMFKAKTIAYIILNQRESNQARAKMLSWGSFSNS